MRSADLCMPRLLSSGSRDASTAAAVLATSWPADPAGVARCLRAVGEVLVGHAPAQPQDGLRVQLGHARLGHAEDLADLAQGQVLVVVERDDELLALGQAGDG